MSVFTFGHHRRIYIPGQDDCFTVTTPAPFYKGMDLVITSGAGRGKRFKITGIVSTTSLTLRRLRWWDYLWYEVRQLARLVLSYMQRWMLYGWLLHVAVCVLVGAVEGILWPVEPTRCRAFLPEKCQIESFKC